VVATPVIGMMTTTVMVIIRRRVGITHPVAGTTVAGTTVTGTTGAGTILRRVVLNPPPGVTMLSLAGIRLHLVAALPPVGAAVVLVGRLECWLRVGTLLLPRVPRQAPLIPKPFPVVAVAQRQAEGRRPLQLSMEALLPAVARSMSLPLPARARPLFREP
jgi:hypothetical protein